jgi:hypothetical protein
MGDSRFVHQCDYIFRRTLLVGNLGIRVTVSEKTGNFWNGGSQLLNILGFYHMNAEDEIYPRRISPDIYNRILKVLVCHCCDDVKRERDGRQ